MKRRAAPAGRTWDCVSMETCLSHKAEEQEELLLYSVLHSSGTLPHAQNVIWQLECFNFRMLAIVN